MKQLFCTAFVAMTAFTLVASCVRADEKEVKAILDKAIKAMGGEDKLAKAATHMTKGKGAFMDSAFTDQTTFQGLDRRRGEFEGQFGKGIFVINVDKGWGKFGDMAFDLEGDMLANQKRAAYLQLIPMTILPLKEKGFKLESGGEEKVGDKPALVLNVTCPDGKDFKLSFDKESGLPVKLVAKVSGFGGEDFVQETLFTDYKSFDGIQCATKHESKRDGEAFIKRETTEFKVLDKVDPKTFDKPE